MRNKRLKLNSSSNILNLDSLVDIVSNKVGILLILAVFISIFSYIEKGELIQKEKESTSNIEKIKIPWSHTSQKNSLLFLLKDDRLIFFDRAQVFKKLRQYLYGKKALPNKIGLKDFSIILTTGSGHAHCVEFLAKPNRGYWWHQIYKENGLIYDLQKKYPTEENYFFFWVDAKSFSSFRRIRESLWNDNFEVGWKPIRKNSILKYCSGSYNRKKFQPQ